MASTLPPITSTTQGPSEVQPGFGFLPGQLIPDAPLIFPGEQDLFMLLEITAEYAGYFGYVGEIIAFIAELILEILKIIDQLVALFTGKPRAQDTLTVAHRLGTGQSPVAHLMSVQISRNLDQNNIVLSSSDPNDQKILGDIRKQAQLMLEQQGVSASRAKQVVDEVWTQTISKNQKLPAELNQPIPQGLLMVGTQQVQQDYINHYNSRIKQGFDPLKAAQLATHWVLYNSKLGDLGKIQIRMKPLIPIPGHLCPPGTHLDPVSLVCVPDSPPPPPPPQPNQTPCPPYTEIPDCLPQAPANDPSQDEIGDAASQVGYWIEIVAIYMMNLYQTIASQSGNTGNDDCCTEVVSGLASISDNLNTIASYVQSLTVPTSGTPIDLSPVVDALNSITSIISSSTPLQDALSAVLTQQLTGIKDAISNAKPVDVQSIVNQLEKMRTQAWETPGFATQLFNTIGMNPALLAIMPQSAPGDHPLGLDGFRAWFETDPSGAELGGIAPYVGKPGGLSEFAKDSPHWTLSHALACGFVDTVLFIAAAANDLVGILWPQIGSTLVQITDLLNQKAPDLVSSLHLLLGKPAEWVISYVTKDASVGYRPTPDNYKQFAQDAFGRAMELGTAAFLVAELGGFIFGEHDHYLGVIAAQIALAASFEDIAKLQLGPYMDAAIRLPATYDANRNLRSRAPGRMEASQLFARRKITDSDRAILFGYDGLLEQYETAITEASYRPLNPRTLANLYVDIPFPRTQVQELLQDYGVNDTHVPILLDAYEYNSAKNVRQAYVSSIIRSAELGSLSEQELQSDLQGLGFSDTATNLVLLTVAQKRLDAILTLYRREISILYSTNQLSDAQYLPALEAAGMNESLANGYYGIDSSKLHGKELATQARAEAKLQAQEIRLAVQTAKSLYMSGQADAVAMATAVTASGLDLNLVPLTIALFTAEYEAKRVDVYGLLLPRDKAILVREKVAAIKEQCIKSLVDATYVTNNLTSLKIPASNQEALLSAWTAQIKGPVLVP